MKTNKKLDTLIVCKNTIKQFITVVLLNNITSFSPKLPTNTIKTLITTCHLNNSEKSSDFFF